MRLIDADELIEHAWRDKLDSRKLIVEMIEKATTIKLISQESIKAVKQQPCEDCISREQAIKQCGFGMTSLHIADCLRKLSPVTPQPKIGQWINNRNGTFECSECGTKHSRSNYCPNCGNPKILEEEE